MLFTSISFLYYFLPIVIALYFILPKKARNVVLFIASLVFYYYGEPKYIYLMIGEILVAYIGALLIDKYKKKSIFIITVVIHIGLLCIFKYTDFMISNVNGIFKTSIPLLRIALPIGISFYTFQILSYVIDVYNGKEIPEGKKSIAFSVELGDSTYGVRRFIIGLAKKVLIANMLGELCTKFTATNEKSVLFYWIFAIGYMLQIYFDFSAYSDMAIGLGRIFGFHFLENFDYPYISKSITEFWRRWHISLSSWFRDYVYIPLGGNRNGVKKQIRNILVVWALTGIWHGASWNFVVWGLMFGVLLIIEKFFLAKHLEKAPNIVKRIYVLFIVMISFIIFNANNMGEAITNIVGLFGANRECFVNNYTLYYLKSYFITIVIAIVGATPLMRNLINKLKENKIMNGIINVLEPVCLMTLMFVVTAYLVDNSYNPFLYFRF